MKLTGARPTARACILLEFSADGTSKKAVRLIVEATGDLFAHRVKEDVGPFSPPGLASADTTGMSVGRIRSEARLASAVAGLIGTRPPPGAALDRLASLREAVGRNPELRPLLDPPSSPRRGLAGAMTEDEAARFFALFGSAPRPRDKLVGGGIQSLAFGGLGFMPAGLCLIRRLPDDWTRARGWLRAVRPRIAWNDGRRLEIPGGGHAGAGRDRARQARPARGRARQLPLRVPGGDDGPGPRAGAGRHGRGRGRAWWWGRERPDAALPLYGEDEYAVAALRADIERQFEFLQQTWLKSPSFHGLSCEKDPILGDAEEGACGYTIPTRGGPVRLSPMPRFVTLRGGGYFFMPGKRLVDWLAAGG